MAVLHLNKSNFIKTIQTSDKPVLVDFWATWCGPCRMLGPVLDQVSGEMQGNAVIAKVNVEEEPELAQNFQIMSIPAMIVFKDGKAVDKLIGLTSSDRIKSVLNRHM